MMNVRRLGRAVLLPLAALALTAGTCDVTRDVTPTTSSNVPTTPVTIDTPVTTVSTTAPPEDSERIDALAAIAAALNVNRLIAIESADLDTLRAIDGTETLFMADRLFANNGGFDFIADPTLETIPYEVTEILLDRTDCVVVTTMIDLRDVLGFDEAEEQIEVVFFDEDGVASLGGILPLGAPERAWIELCDDTERTAVPIEP